MAERSLGEEFDSSPEKSPNFFSLEGENNKLPGDLINAVFPVLEIYQMSGLTENDKNEFLKRLKSIGTFREYFAKKLEKHNKAIKGESGLCDLETSLSVELEKIGSHLVDEFDQKVLELRRLAEIEFDERNIENKIQEIYELFKK